MAESINVDIGLGANAKGLYAGLQQAQEAMAKTKASAVGLNAEWAKGAKLTGDIAKTSKLNAASMVADQSKILQATSITSAKLAQQEILLNSLYGAGSKVMEKRYLSSIQGLSFALERANKEFKNTIVIHKGVASAMSEAGNGMDRFRIKADMSVRTLENMNTKMTNVGKNMQWTGRQLMVGVTSGIVGIGTVAVKSFMDIETAAKHARAMVGDQAMPALEKSAKDMAATWGVSTTQAITSLAELQKSLGTTADTTKKLGNLAASFDQIGNINNLDKSTSFIKALYNSTKDIDKTTKSVQMLGAVGQSTNIDLSNMADVMPKAIPLFKEFNISLATGVSYLAAFKENSVDPAAGLQGLKILLGNLNSATSGGVSNVKTIKKEIQSLNDEAGKGITFTNGQGQFDGSTAIQSLAKAYGKLNDQQRQAMAINLVSTTAGRRQFANILPLLNSVANAYGYIGTTVDGAASKVGDFQKAQEIANMSASDLAKNWDGLGKQFQKDPTTVFKALKEQLKQAGAEIGGTLMPYLIQVVGWIKKGLDWFNGLGSGTKKWIADLAIGAALIGPIVYAIGQMVVLSSTIAKAGFVRPLAAMFKLRSRPMERMLGEGKGKLYGGDTQLQGYMRNVSSNPEIPIEKKIKVQNSINDYVKAGDRSDMAKEALIKKLDQILAVEDKDKQATEKHTKSVKEDTKALTDAEKAKKRQDKIARLAEESKPLIKNGKLDRKDLMLGGMTSSDASLVIAKLKNEGFLTDAKSKPVAGEKLSEQVKKGVVEGTKESVKSAKDATKESAGKKEEVKVANSASDPVPVKVTNVDPKAGKAAEAQAKATAQPETSVVPAHTPVAIIPEGNKKGKKTPVVVIPENNEKARITTEDSEVVPVGGRNTPTSETIVKPVREAVREGVKGVRSARNPLGEIGAAQLAGAVARGLDEHAKQRGGHAGLATESIRRETAGAWDQMAGVVQRNFKNVAAENQLNQYIKYLRNDQNMSPDVAAYGTAESAFDKTGKPRKKVVTGYQNISESVNSLFDLDKNGNAVPRYKTHSSVQPGGPGATTTTPLTEVSLKQWTTDMKQTHKDMNAVITRLQSYDKLTKKDQKILSDLIEARKELLADIRRTRSAVLQARSSSGESMGLPEPSYGGQSSSSSLNTELAKKGLQFSRVTNGQLYQSKAVAAATPDLMAKLGFGKATSSAQLPVAAMKAAADEAVSDVEFIKKNLPKRFIDVIMGRAVGGMSQAEVERYLQAHLKAEHWDQYGQQIAQRINSVAEKVAIEEGFSGSQLATFAQARPTQNVQNERDLEEEARRRKEAADRNKEIPQHKLTQEVIPEQTTWITDPHTGQRQRLGEEDAAAVAQKVRADEEAKHKKAVEDRLAWEDQVNKNSGMTPEERAAQFTPEAMARKRSLAARAGMAAHQVRSQVVKTNAPRVAPGPMPDESNPEAGFFRPWAFLDRFAKTANTEVPKIEKNGNSVFEGIKNLFAHIKAGSDAADKHIMAGNRHIDASSIGSKLKSGTGKLFGLGQGGVKNSGGGGQGIKSGLLGGAIQAIMPGGDGMGMMMTGMLPQTLAIAGMTALMGVLAAHWKDIQKGITDGLNNIQKALGPLVSAIVKPFEALLGIGGKAKQEAGAQADVWKQVGEHLNGIFNALAKTIEFLTPIIGFLARSIAGVIGWGIQFVRVCVDLLSWIQKLPAPLKLVADALIAIKVGQMLGLWSKLIGMGSSIVKFFVSLAARITGATVAENGFNISLTATQALMGGLAVGLGAVALLYKGVADAASKGAKAASDFADSENKKVAGNTIDDLNQKMKDYQAQYDVIYKKGQEAKKRESSWNPYSKYMGTRDLEKSVADLKALKAQYGDIEGAYKNEMTNLFLLGKAYNMTEQQLYAFAKAHNIDLTKDSKSVGEQMGMAMREGVANKLDDKGNPIPAPAIGDPSQSVSDFVSQFQTEMKKQTAGWKKEALDAFDDQSKNKLKSIDEQIKAIAKLDKVDAEAAKAEQRRLKQKEIDEEAATAKNAYITDRSLALYEGKYDVAKQLDLKYMETKDKIADKQTTLNKDNLNEDIKDKREAQKLALEDQKTALQAQLDLQKETLTKALDALDEFIPHSKAEAEKLRTNMFQALTDAGVDIASISNKQGALFTKGWEDAMTNTQKALDDKEFWTKLSTSAGNDAFFAGTKIAKSFLDGTNADPNNPLAGVSGGASDPGSGMAGNGTSAGGPNGNGTQAGDNAVGTTPSGGYGSSANASEYRRMRQQYSDGGSYHTGGNIGSAAGSPQDVPATLQTGEFVIQRKAANAIGLDNLELLNQAHQKPKFHTGGLVGGLGDSMKSQFNKQVEAFKHGKASIAGQSLNMLKQKLMPKGIGSMPAGYDVSKLSLADLANGGMMAGTEGLQPGALQLLELIFSKFPGIVFTSGFRPGGSSYHAFGQAVDVDFGGSHEADMAVENYLAPLGAAGVLAELIHSPGDNNYLNGRKGTAVDLYGADTANQHYNHVHAAVANAFAGGLKNISMPIVPGSAPTGSAQEYIKSLLPKFGWGDGEWGSLQQLVEHESSWNPSAHNSIGAAGLFQFLPSTWQSYITDRGGAPYWSTDLSTQGQGGLTYIKERYGSPSAAWDFWQRRVPINGQDVGNWYHKGGPVSLDVGGMIKDDGWAKVHKGEAVVTKNLMENGIKGGDTKIDLNLHFDGGFFGSDREIEKLVDTIETRLVPRLERAQGNETRHFRSYR